MSGLASGGLAFVAWDGVVPMDILERVKAAALNSENFPKARGDQPAVGWVGHRHLLDTKFEGAEFEPGVVLVHLVSVGRSIPKGLLDAEVSIEKEAMMRAAGLAFLTRGMRLEAVREVETRLFPSMPLSPRGVWVLFDLKRKQLFTSAMSDSQHDALWAALIRLDSKQWHSRQTDIIAQAAGVDTRELDYAHYGDGPIPEMFTATSDDFLMWFWWAIESRALPITDALVEGPLTFANDGSGAKRVVIKDGAPEVASEVVSTVLAGKKLVGCRIRVVRGSDTYKAAIDINLTVRGLTLPDGDVFADNRLSDRYEKMCWFCDWLTERYREYCLSRKEPLVWANCVRGIREWIRARPTQQ